MLGIYFCFKQLFTKSRIHNLWNKQTEDRPFHAFVLVFLTFCLTTWRAWCCYFTWQIKNLSVHSAICQSKLVDVRQVYNILMNISVKPLCGSQISVLFCLFYTPSLVPAELHASSSVPVCRLHRQVLYAFSFRQLCQHSCIDRPVGVNKASVCAPSED